MIIRYAAPQDVPQMLLIYEPYIADSAITFETVVPARTEFENRLKIVINGFPWLICERLGFSEFALFNKIGYKNSSWHDVLWMVLVINSHEKEQSNPLLFSDLRSDFRVLEIIRKETTLLNQ